MKKIFQFLIVFITIGLYSNLGIAQTMKNYVEFKGTKYELNNSSIKIGDLGVNTMLIQTTTTSFLDTCFTGGGAGIYIELEMEPNIMNGTYSGTEAMNGGVNTYYWGSSYLQILKKDGTSQKIPFGDGTFTISGSSKSYSFDGTINTWDESDGSIKIHYIGKIETKK